ncbi:phosphatidylinositol-specific phospholipase C domain-containing protein [Xenorhabdus innexi]|uniref:1-phosphatidylinositol phosphodiesterase n=1 Tax=Xenorhabdus innexi TaxID=290109 RepID=A0A1N6MXB1_9GAMM
MKKIETVVNSSTQGIDYSADDKESWQSEIWMKNIDDKKSIALLSVPGTHESCATYSPDRDLFGVIICQTLSVETQLQKGIRFLDIRCRAIDGIFAIHHDLVYQKINFGDVLNQCIDFLSSHPSETIFMRIKQE